jgi:hypothetical protein
MILVRVGRRWLNLEYLILAEEWGDPEEPHSWGPGGLRVTLVSGRVFDLPPAEATTVRRRLEAILAEPPQVGGGESVTVHDPATGAPLPPAAPRKKRRR